MAKSGFWLRGSKGKLAGATLYKDANGDTVMREVVTPKNPQTTKQMVQRIIMNTIMQAYSAMKEITDHSFENVPAGAKTMQVFMKRNLDFAREKLSQMQAQGVDFFDMYNFVPLGVKAFVPNQYLISTGSLPQVTSSFVNEGTQLHSLVVSAIKVNTYQGVCDALGAQRGDQVTFLTFSSNANISSRFRFTRVILDPTNEDGSQAAMSTPFLVEGAINAPSVRNEGTAEFDFTISETAGFAIEPKGESCFAGGVILSRLVNDSWLRSTCRLIYNEQMTALSGRSMGECLRSALQGKAIYAPADLYLNNAGQGGTAAVEAGSDAPSGDSGSGSSSGSGTGSLTPTASITAVSVNGSAAVAGTEKIVSPAGEGNNVVSLTFSAVPQGKHYYIRTSANATANVWEGVPTQTTLAIPLTDPEPTLNTTYKLYDADGYLNYSFRISNSSGPEMN